MFLKMLHFPLQRILTFLFHEQPQIVSNTTYALKNLVWHSHNFLLPYTVVEEYFIISFTFIFDLYFQCFTVDKIPAFIVIVNNFRILLECGCIHLIRTTK